MIICFLKTIIYWKQVGRVLWLIVREPDLAIIELRNESVNWMAHQIDESQIERLWKIKVVKVAGIHKSSEKADSYSFYEK